MEMVPQELVNVKSAISPGRFYPMQDFVINFLNQYGYFGIGFLLALETVFPPIPSEIVLTFGGFATTYSEMNIWMVILSATIGSVIGAIILYFIGRLIFIEYSHKEHNGRISELLHLKPGDIAKAERWFEKRGYLAVFLCRFVPIARSLISIPAGTANMKFGMFLLLTTIGTAIWNTILVWLGALAGASWENIVRDMGAYSITAVVIMGVLTVVFAIKFYLSRIKGN